MPSYLFSLTNQLNQVRTYKLFNSVSDSTKVLLSQYIPTSIASNCRRLKMGLLQVIVATVATQILGFVWYSADYPLGKVWLKHASVRGRLGNSQVPMLVAFVCKLVLALLLDDRFRFLIAGGSIMATAERALWMSTIPSLCYATHVVFLGHEWPAILVDITYDAASLAAMAVILVHL